MSGNDHLTWWERRSTRFKRVLGWSLVGFMLGGMVTCAVVERATRDVEEESVRPTATRTLPTLTDAVLPVSKTAVQTAFEQRGFVFEPIELPEEPDLRITRGNHPDDPYLGSVIVLYETPMGLGAVSHIASTRGTSHELGMRNVYRLWLLWTVLPEWTEQANDWLSDGLRSPGGTARQVGNTLVNLEYRPVVGTDDGIRVLTLKALRPD